MATPATTRYVPTFGDPDDLRLVDLTFPLPFTDDEDAGEAAAALDVERDVIVAMLKDMSDEDHRSRARLEIDLAWQRRKLSTIADWTDFWREEGSICLPGDLTDREIDGLNRDLGLIDVFPDPPYGYPLTATLE